MEAKVALVTGANRGIGAAVAARLAARGHQVVIAARQVADAQQAAARLGGDTRAVRLDVTDPASVAAARQAVGPIDILVNNAGVLLDGGEDPLLVPLELVELTWRINALGAWRVCQAFVPDMVTRRWGRVVMVSSGTGAFSNGIFVGAPGYSTSKTALNAVTSMLAAATQGSGVLINAVNPGLVHTRMRPDAQRSAQDAAVDVEYLVSLDDDGPSGCFFRGSRQINW